VRLVPVPAKINLALVVGPRRADGLHPVATVLQRIDLCDWLGVEPARRLSVEGFRRDTIVRPALERLAEAAGVEPRWRVRLVKRIPLAAGLGGGSADAAAGLALANETLDRPLPPAELARVAAAVGADVPFFLEPGPKLAEGAGEQLEALDLPQDFWAVIGLPWGASKRSTADVYTRFDDMDGGHDFAARRRAALDAIRECRRPRHLAALPANDLAEAAGRPALVDELLRAGAFRADVSGAGPAVYGLFHRRAEARAALRSCSAARTWVVSAVW
jgi:4-diphosphocytidyl-2-C-methyl-D-erythritol kinase